MTKPESMLLYHAFPRRLSRERAVHFGMGWDRQRHNQAGLAILESIVREGLLLTPETLEIPPNPRAEGSVASDHTQIRACFTASSRTAMIRRPNQETLGDYSDHSDRFGEFAIGLDPVEGRHLGMMPTVYFYEDNDLHDPSHQEYASVACEQGFSFQLIYRLVETIDLLKVLARIEAESDWSARLSPPELEAAGYTLSQYPLLVEALEEFCRSGRARTLHKAILDTDRVPVWNLVESLRLFLDLFQTADSRQRDLTLAYFQQREWRLPAVYGSLSGAKALRDVYPMAIRRTPYLINTNRRLRELGAGAGSDVALSDRALMESWVRESFGRRTFWTFVVEMIYPRECDAEVRAVIARCGRGHVPMLVPV